MQKRNNFRASSKELRKYELDLKFLVTCRDTGVFMNFTLWKNVNKNNKFKNRFYRKILPDETSKKQRSIRLMKKYFKTSMENLLVSTTFFKGVTLKISINRSVIKEEKAVLKCPQKKLDSLLKEKNKLNDI